MLAACFERQQFSTDHFEDRLDRGQHFGPGGGQRHRSFNEPTISAGTPPPPKKLVTKDLVVGTGKTATKADSVTVQYRGGRLHQRQGLRRQLDHGPTGHFPLSDVVPGFARALPV